MIYFSESCNFASWIIPCSNNLLILNKDHVETLRTTESRNVSAVMYECESWESWALKNWCFWTVVLAESFESALDWKEIQPIYPKGISPEYSLEGLMLKLKLQYFGHLMWRTDSLEKTLMLGKMKVGGEWDGWMASPTQWTWVWVNSGSWWWAGRPGVLQSMGLQRVGYDWATELNWYILLIYVTKEVILNIFIIRIWFAYLIMSFG